MKTTNLHLILAAMFTILSVPALAKVEPHLPEDPTGILIGRANPELAGIEQLYIRIIQVGTGPSKNGLVWKELRTKVGQKLVKAGIRMYSGTVRDWPTTPGTPVLEVDIDMLKLKDSQQFVFRIQTYLVRTVALQAQPNLHFHADVWKANASMQAVSVQNILATVSALVLAQVDSFIEDYRIANPPGRQPADANDFAALITAPTREIKKPVKLITSEHDFVASKNSKVFHKPTCSSVKRIKPGNLVTYGTRDKAAEAGKRPCKICKP